MKKLLFIAIVAVLGLTACGPSAEELVQQGKAYLENDDCEKAVKCFGKAVEKGNAKAMYEIGLMYYDGICVDKDHESAATWFKHAADIGYPDAQNKLAMMYWAGNGVEKNDEKAVKWAQLALGIGEYLGSHYWESYYVLGICYVTGKVLPQDNKNGVKYLQKAADMNILVAPVVDKILLPLYLEGEGVQDDEKAITACCGVKLNIDRAEAMNSIGMMYYNGEGVDKNTTKAFNWFKRAANAGNATAQYNTAVAYYYGIGVNKSLTENRKWLKMAAENGNADAQFNLGGAYITGVGVPQNMTEAKYWLQKAADQGHKEAKEELEALRKVEKMKYANKTFTVNGVSFEMIAVKGGTFTMGGTAEQSSDARSDEKPTHSVTLSDYYIGKFEVTQELWQAVMGSNPSQFRGDNLPVEYVSWNDVQEFIKKLNQQTGYNFRLPTEAEWEYAARGGSKSKGYKYSGSNNIGDVAWYNDNSGGKTIQVGTKASNELGIYDMSGNVYEWCQDWYYGYYSSGSQNNPEGPSSGKNRVLRGGSWYYSAWICRVSNRFYSYPVERNNKYGFRLAMSY